MSLPVSESTWRGTMASVRPTQHNRCNASREIPSTYMDFPYPKKRLSGAGTLRLWNTLEWLVGDSKYTFHPKSVTGCGSTVLGNSGIDCQSTWFARGVTTTTQFSRWETGCEFSWENPRRGTRDRVFARCFLETDIQFQFRKTVRLVLPALPFSLDGQR